MRCQTALALLLLAALSLAACAAQPFARWKADDVMRHLQASGLPVTDVRDQPIGGGVAPATEIESVEFTIDSIAPNGGQCLIFKDQPGLDAKRAWFARFPDLAPYVYVKDNAMLQLNSGLPVVEAEKYKQALDALK